MLCVFVCLWVCVCVLRTCVFVSFTCRVFSCSCVIMCDCMFVDLLDGSCLYFDVFLLDSCVSGWCVLGVCVCVCVCLCACVCVCVARL